MLRDRPAETALVNSTAPFARLDFPVGVAIGRAANFRVQKKRDWMIPVPFLCMDLWVDCLFDVVHAHGVGDDVASVDDADHASAV